MTERERALDALARATVVARAGKDAEAFGMLTGYIMASHRISMNELEAAVKAANENAACVGAQAAGMA